MKIKVRYQILSAFILIFFVLFFISNRIASAIIKDNSYDVLTQLIKSIIFRWIGVGADLTILLLFAVVGMLYYKKIRKNEEYYFGFLYSLLFSVFLLLVFVLVIGFSYWNS